MAQGMVLRWAHAYVKTEPWVPLEARILLSIACTRRHLHCSLVIRESFHKLFNKSIPVWVSKHTTSSYIKIKKKPACVYQNIKLRSLKHSKPFDCGLVNISDLPLLTSQYPLIYRHSSNQQTENFTTF